MSEGHEFISILYCQVSPSKNKVDYYYYSKQQVYNSFLSDLLAKFFRTSNGPSKKQTIITNKFSLA